LPVISPRFFLHKLGCLLLSTTMAIPSSSPWQPPWHGGLSGSRSICRGKASMPRS
jgi:hypothetical protein